MPERNIKRRGGQRRRRGGDGLASATQSRTANYSQKASNGVAQAKGALTGAVSKGTSFFTNFFKKGDEKQPKRSLFGGPSSSTTKYQERAEPVSRRWPPSTYGGKRRTVRRGGKSRTVRRGGKRRTVRRGGKSRTVRRGGKSRTVRRGGKSRTVRRYRH